MFTTGQGIQRLDVYYGSATSLVSNERELLPCIMHCFLELELEWRNMVSMHRITSKAAENVLQLSRAISQLELTTAGHCQNDGPTCNGTAAYIALNT